MTEAGWPSKSATDVTTAEDGDYEVVYDESTEDTTETRRSVFTSEFYVWLVTSVALLFFTYESGRDSLAREDGWRYVAAITVAYLLSRGLAKVGSYEKSDG